MFLALYRCIESLYAYSSAQKIISDLNLTHNWGEVAVALEDHLGWHPREESSLGELLINAARGDLEDIFRSTGEKVPEIGDLASATGRRIYQLRNNLVHFRPLHQQFDPQLVDWNRLCETMATLVWHIYTEVFSDPSTTS
jgi:hypothetical protein